MNSLDIIVRENAGWQRFFALSGISPLYITTDQIVADNRAVVGKIAAAIDVSVDAASVDAIVEISKAYDVSDLKTELSAVLDAMSPGSRFR